jgi:hypothetical protein
MSDRVRCDILVYGATSAGVTAAVQAARMRASVILLEPGRHVGGMTSSGLGATDYGNKASIGGLAREFYRRVKDHYARSSAWTWQRPEGYRCHGHDPAEDVMWFLEPRVAERIFIDMVREARVRVIFGERLDLTSSDVRKRGPRITSIATESGNTYAARVFIDATYEGDLMARAGVEYHVGRESNSAYGEVLNGVQTRRVPYNGHNFFRPVDPFVVPGDRSSGLLFGVHRDPPGEEGAGDHRAQAYCFRLCMTDVPENRVPFPMPPDYDPRRYELLLRYLQSQDTQQLFPDHPDPQPIENPVLGYDPNFVIMPNRKTDSNTKGAISFNFVGGNYDYPNADHATRQRIVEAHRHWQQGLIWFVQNDPRVPVRYGEPLQCWGLPRDEFVDNGHWPHQLYVREARRMIGEYVMTEHDCAGERRCDDSVGLGSYAMDSHVTQRYFGPDGFVRNEGNLGGRVPAPYPISYRALTPKRDQCDNLLVPVCCSASHVAYGSIRMEPVYMILGHSAGAAAALAAASHLGVQRVEYAALSAALAEQRQELLVSGRVA